MNILKILKEINTYKNIKDRSLCIVLLFSRYVYDIKIVISSLII